MTHAGCRDFAVNKQAANRKAQHKEVRLHNYELDVLIEHGTSVLPSRSIFVNSRNWIFNQYEREVTRVALYTEWIDCKFLFHKTMSRICIVSFSQVRFVRHQTRIPNVIFIGISVL